MPKGEPRSPVVGRRRSHLQRPARGESPGLEQPARRAGFRAQQRARRRTDRRRNRPTVLPLCRSTSDWPRGAQDDDELNLVDLRNSLSSEMWRDVGIRRDRTGLESAERQVDFWNRYVAAREFADPHGWELQNMLLVARLIIAGALARQESRGTHFRIDYPQADPAQATHIEISDSE